ncbi:uncharacterized protein [Amphiura filiformis]|uniref:uncharacterized protein n=1 Tax=Amphiura filiformis TaxID=82378 RepID=UPI003B213369
MDLYKFCSSLEILLETVDASIATLQRENGDLRLVNGPTKYEGRVEIYYHHQWGTICDDSWSIEDAMVVCEQLGFGAAYLAREGAYYGHGTGNITLDEILCNGLETRLDQCAHGGWFVHNCDHSEDAGVWCEEPSDPIIDLDISPGAIVGGVLHAIVLFILIFACVRYCFVSRKCTKRRERRDSSAHILQSAYSVDGQLENNTEHPPSYEQCRLFSPNGSCTNSSSPATAIFSSSTNNLSSFSYPTFLNSRHSQSERFEDFSVSMVTERTDRVQHNEPLPPPAYDSVMGALVIRVT